MNVKHLDKIRLLRLYRRLSIGIAILVILISAICLGMKYALQQVNLKSDIIASIIKKELGFPVVFQSIEADYFGFSLGISLNQVLVADSEVPVNFIAIERVKLFPELKTLIFDKKPVFTKIVLEGMKLVVGFDEVQGISVLGLQGEPIATLIDYAQLMKVLSLQKALYFEDASIKWQGKNWQFDQLWEGEFFWEDTLEPKKWSIVGTQHLQNENGKFPVTSFRILADQQPNEIVIGVGAQDELGKCNFQLKTNHLWGLDCKSHLQDISVATLHQFYQPKSGDPKWLQWLHGAISNGNMAKILFSIHGSLQELQWHGQIDFSEADFLYLRDWPKISDGFGSVTVEQDEVKIKLHKGNILDAKIEKANILANWSESQPYPVVKVDGEVLGTLEGGLNFLNKSPLKKSVADMFAVLVPKGHMILNLQLNIPIMAKQAVGVFGSLKTKQASIKIPKWNHMINQIAGTFDFTENSLTAKEIKAQLAKQALSIDLQSDFSGRDPKLQILASSILTSKYLQQKLQYPFLKNLSGQSSFKVALNYAFKNSLLEWTVSSDLQGMGIQLPGFLAKQANDKRHMKLWIGEHKGESRLSFQLEDIADLKITLGKTCGKDKNSYYKGHLVFGKAAADWNFKEGLLIGGEISHLNVSEWQNYFKDLGDKNQLFAKYDIHVLINQLELFGLVFDKTWLSASAKSLPHQWRLDGPLVSGSITEDKQNILVDMTFLNAKPSHQLEKKDLLSRLKNKSISFNCKHFQYQKKDFGSLSFKLIPENHGYLIKDFNLESSIRTFIGDGHWTVEHNKQYTAIQGKLISINMGESLSDLGYPSEIREGSGYIHYDFQWPEDPFHFKMESVVGVAELKLDKGRIIGVDPGLGRVMGLLNLENIRRRLQLDFSDLLKKGFVFDTMRGSFNFNNGVVKTESLLINGPSAKIDLNGTAILKTKAIDLKMTIMPHMGMGLPIAAAIASGNPAIGAGVWIIDKITGSKIKKITQHRYQVTGTWDAPTISDLEARDSESNNKDPKNFEDINKDELKKNQSKMLKKKKVNHKKPAKDKK